MALSLVSLIHEGYELRRLDPVGNAIEPSSGHGGGTLDRRDLSGLGSGSIDLFSTTNGDEYGNGCGDGGGFSPGEGEDDFDQWGDGTAYSVPVSYQIEYRP